MTQRSIIFGDIHGCLEELKELLDEIEFKFGEDLLYSVGDLTDRGPYSQGVVALARRLNIKCVQSNHDERYVRHRKHLRKTGKSPINLGREKQAVYASLTDEDLDYLESLPYYIRLAPNLVLVHAGLQRGIDVEHQYPDTLTHMRYAMRDTGKMAGMKKKEEEFLRPADSAFWTELWDGKDSVIYGHHPQKLAIDYPQPGVVCFGIDSGACFGEELTCMMFTEIPTNIDDFKYEFASVKAKETYAKRFKDGVIDG